MSMEEAIKVAASTAKLARQCFNGQGEYFIDRQTFKKLAYMFLDADKTALLGWGIFNLVRQDGSGNAQQLAAMVKVQVGWNMAQQAVALHGKNAGSRIALDGLEKIRDDLQKANFMAPKQGKEVFAVGRKKPEAHPLFVVGTKLALGSSIQDKDIAGSDGLRDLTGETLASAFFHEHE